MSDKKGVAQKLLQINAIKLSPENPFTWASGWRSPIYCDNRRVLSFPFERDFIKSELCNEVFQSFPDTTVIAGVATAGIPWGAMIADQLKLPFIYVRPKPKDHGLGNQIEGFFEKNSKVVIIEDLISTGKSSMQVVDLLKGEGATILGMVSIFTYGFDAAKTLFSNAAVQLKSLTDYPTLLSLAKEMGQIDEATEQTLLKWSIDPANWGKEL